MHKEGLNLLKKLKFNLSILLTFLIIFSSTIFNVNPIKANAVEPPTGDVHLVLDPSQTEAIPDHFRKSSNGLNESTAKGINTTGLKELNISGSEQFAEFNLPIVIKSIGDYKLTIVDLRQESHGFVNGFPVSFKNSLNNANEGLSRDQVINKEIADLSSIKVNEPITFFNKPKNSVVVKDVKRETDVAKSNNVSYLRVPVTDRKLPTDDMVDFFVSSVKDLPKNSWLHFHCKHGIGRTTTFMILYDMMKNSKDVPMNDIIQRQLLLANFDEKEIKSFNNPGRSKLFTDFYNYCKSNDGFKTSWTDWKNKNKVTINSTFTDKNLTVNKNENNLLHSYTNAFVNTNTNISSYIKSSNMPNYLYVISQNEMSSSERTMIATLQGLISQRSSSQIYTLNSSQPDYKIWLYDLKLNHNIQYEIIHNPWKLIDMFKDYISGYILYNTTSNKPNDSINNACSLAALKNSIVIEESLEDKIQTLGLTKSYDCRNTDKSWAYNNLWDKYLNHSTVIQLSPLKDTSLRDYAVMTKSLVFYEDSIEDTFLRNKIFSSMPPNGIVLGWGPDEFVNVSTASKYGVSVVAADWSYNLSVLSSLPLKKLTQSPSPNIPKEENVHYVTFIMSDGDNQQWCLGSNFNSPKWYGSPYRGNFDLGWSLSPALYYLSPTVFDMYYKTASNLKGRDYFVVPPSGNGYMYPSKFEKTKLNSYIDTLNSYMKQVNQKYITIIDDGSFYDKALWQSFLSKPNIDGLFYLDYHRHDKYKGDILWVNNKPVVSCKELLWSNLQDEEGLISSINNNVNLGQVDVHNSNSYTFVYVHVWSKDVQNVETVVKKLNENPKIRVVTPDTFMKLIKQNLPH